MVNGSYQEARLQIYVYLTAYFTQIEELGKHRSGSIGLPGIAFIVNIIIPAVAELQRGVQNFEWALAGSPIRARNQF